MDFLTTGDIAEKLNVDRDVVCYALRKAKVEPIGRAGIARMFSGSALRTVEDFLETRRQKNENGN